MFVLKYRFWRKIPSWIWNCAKRVVPPGKPKGRSVCVPLCHPTPANKNKLLFKVIADEGIKLETSGELTERLSVSPTDTTVGMFDPKWRAKKGPNLLTLCSLKCCTIGCSVSQPTGKAQQRVRNTGKVRKLLLWRETLSSESVSQCCALSAFAANEPRLPQAARLKLILGITFRSALWQYFSAKS